MRPAAPRVWLTLGLALLPIGAPLAAQDSVATAPAVPVPAPDTTKSAPSAPRPDSLVRRPHVSPLGALWRSFLIPGWGQARLGRNVTAAVFVTTEGICLGMTLKAEQERKWLRAMNDPRGESKAKEAQDWLVLLVFNHLISGLEAFAAAHLANFPGDLGLEVAPSPSGLHAEVTLPLPRP